MVSMERKNMSKETNENELVPLHSLPRSYYAQMVKEVLEKRGIPCLIKGDVLSTAYGSGGMEVKILVPKGRKKEAEAILEEMLDHI